MANIKNRYSKKESLNRIYRVLKGAPEPSNTPDVLIPEVLSEDEALGLIAQLLASALPGETFTDPMAEFAEIYVWTGTSTMSPLLTTAVKITGTFQNDVLYNYGADPQYESDRIVLSGKGIYFVDWSASINANPNIEYLIEPYHAAIGMPQAAARVKPYTSGSFTVIGGVGIFVASGTSEAVDLRVICDTSGSAAWLTVYTASLRVNRIRGLDS